MLIARDNGGDRQRALSLLADAGETARRIGMRGLLDQVLGLRIEAQGLSSTNVMTSISAVASAAQRDHTDLRPLAAPDGSVTIMFSDIEGSTSINERLGDRDWMELLRAHNTIVREELKAHGGNEVKTAGDGFMVAFSSPLRAVECAIGIQRGFAAHNERHTEHPLRVRIGLHTGTPVVEGGDYYGKDVTLAFRIADEAQGGEIVISGRLRELIEGESAVPFGGRREIGLKGLSGAHVVFAVKWLVD
jgi:class 3 adenylate cyclase